MQAFTDFQDFLSALTTEQTLLLAIVGVLILLFGILIGWIVQGSKTKRYRKQLLVVTQERDDYQRQYQTAKTAQETTAKELERVSNEKVAALDRAQSLTTQLANRDNQLRQLQADNEQLVSTNQSYATTIDDLNDQVIGLKTQNEQLIANGGGTPTNPDGQGNGQADAQDFAPYLEAIEARFQAFDRRLDELSAATDPASGGDSTEPATPQTPNYPGHQVTIGEPAQTTDDEEPLVIRADTTDPGARTGSQGRTEVVVDTKPSLQVPVMEVVGEDHDDLTEIKTIGPFNQRKLNENGIYSYAQIADWTDEDLEEYAQKIGYIAELMRSENWIGQAKKMVELRNENPESYQRSPVTTEGDNLKAVEGIGPKIEGILKEAGIDSLATLASTPADEIRAMLEQAGGRYKSHDPGTWPEQAALAVDGNWEELKELQAKLNGGR